VIPTGTPVRPEFAGLDTERCRAALGLELQRPVLLVTGGSQGAGAINRLLMDAAPLIVRDVPTLQILHLTGAQDEQAVRDAYARDHVTARVQAFLPEMAQALGAATIAVSRAGASSLAELAAVRLPALLVPYPTAADDHQFHNAKAYADTGAAMMRTQMELTVQSLTVALVGLLRDDPQRLAMREALARWESPRAARLVADHMLASLHTLGVQRPPLARSPKDNREPPHARSLCQPV
jgi:UDP-N-acetylglucosamine--N-acetylmuramyl-(pentapeptide) pyrophosphoryl-undecaprenol N-acetylglucosamine transferase